MPSSLIIVALAVAWLVVLVPMVARKRQEIARTGEDALAARVVRSGARDDEREESNMPESEELRRDVAARVGEEDIALEADEVDDLEDDSYAEALDDHEEEDLHEDQRRPSYRKGRGGFDPEAAELAARAKYTFRQRVVMILLATVLVSAVLAGFLWSGLWWITGLAGATLVGYLGYLRRQVRIEEEIRRRRLARMRATSGRARSASRARAPRPIELEDELDGHYVEEYADEYTDYDEYEVIEEQRMSVRGVERKPRPHARAPRRNTVVVDLDDEDPAFHELDEPGPPVYRRAVGE